MGGKKVALNLITCMGETPELSVLLNRVAHPVNLGIASDGLVVGVDHDDLDNQY